MIYLHVSGGGGLGAAGGHDHGRGRGAVDVAEAAGGRGGLLGEPVVALVHGQGLEVLGPLACLRALGLVADDDGPVMMLCE